MPTIAAQVRSTGETMRLLAAEHGVSIAELSRVLGAGNANTAADTADAVRGGGDVKGLGDLGDLGGLLVDVTLDYKTCEFLAAPHRDAHVVVCEGRQPAVMAAFCKTLFPVDPFCVYLTCSVREQALRYVSRECGKGALAAVEEVLGAEEGRDSGGGGGNEYASLADVLDVFSRAPSLRSLDGMDRVVAGFEDNMSRDADDKARFDALYGPQCHYRHPQFYDLVVDTSDISSQAKVDARWRIRGVVAAQTKQISVRGWRGVEQ